MNTQGRDMGGAAPATPAPLLGPAPSAAAAEGIERLCAQLLPIWGEQVETARRQAEEAIVGLLGRFAEIGQRVSHLVGPGAARDAIGDARAETFDGIVQARAKLREVETGLTSILREHEGFEAPLRELADGVSGLQGRAAAMSEIAAQSGRLAHQLEDAIKQCGVPAASFAPAIATARRLFSRCAAVEDELEQDLAALGETVVAVRHALNRGSHRETAALRGCETTVAAIDGSLKDLAGRLEQSIQAQQGHGAALQSGISQVVQGLQFQDRMSQILSLVKGDIERLHRRLDGIDGAGREALSVDDWVQRLLGAYSSLQHGTAPASPAPNAAAESEVTLF